MMEPKIYTTRNGRKAVVLTESAPGDWPWVGYWEFTHSEPPLLACHSHQWHGMGAWCGIESGWDLVREGYEAPAPVAEAAE